MTRQQAEALGYVVATRLIDAEGVPPRVAVVTLKRGTTSAPWAAVEQTLNGPGLGGLNDVLDALVARINEPVPPEPTPQPGSDPFSELHARIDALSARVAALEAGQ